MFAMNTRMLYGVGALERLDGLVRCTCILIAVIIFYCYSVCSLLVGELNRWVAKSMQGSVAAM
jgi:hypothetical protein